MVLNANAKQSPGVAASPVERTTDPRRAAHRVTSLELFVMCFVAVGSLTYGYSSSIISSTLSQPSFISYFALDTRSNSTQLQGAMNGLFQTGGLFGCLASCFFSDRLGRKKAIFLYSVLTVIGGALQAGSVNIGMYIFVRFLTGLGVGGLVVCIPLYQSEISRPFSRGIMVGTHGVMIVIGYTISSWVGLGFYYVKTTNGAQWRVPLALQAIFPLILAIGIMFFPESPRWLIAQNRLDEAEQVLLKVRGADQEDSPDYKLTQVELLQMSQQHQIDSQLNTGWYELFTVPSYRKRMLLGFATLAAGQMTGTLVINNYGPTLYAGLGFTTPQSLAIQGGWITVSIFGNTINAWAIDKIGRTAHLKIGLAGCIVALVGECITLSVYQDHGGKRGAAIGAVVFLFMHIAMYSGNMDVTTYIYAAEVAVPHKRAECMSFSVSGLFLSTIVYLQCASTAFANIGWKYYLVFICGCAVFLVLVYVYFPETNHYSLEEVAEIFGDPKLDIHFSSYTSLETKISDQQEENHAPSV